MEARNDPDGLEAQVCEAFRSLGFEAVPFGGKKKPDGVATAHLSVGEDGNPRSYKVSLEAKSKEGDKGKVAASTVKISTIARHRDDFGCGHAIVVGRDFPTSQPESSLEIEIKADLENSEAKGKRKTITLIRIDDLARLVKLRPVKQLTLHNLRQLFETCRLPDESAAWVDDLAGTVVSKPPYKKIVEQIESLQKKYDRAPVSYGSLRVALSYVGVEFDTDEELMELCKGMMQMAPGAIYAGTAQVELDQSAANVLAAIETATTDYPENSIAE